MTVTNLPIVMIQIVPMTPIAQGAHALLILLIIRSPVKVIAFLQVPTAATDKEHGVRLVVNAGMEAAAPLNGYVITIVCREQDTSVVMMELVGTAPQMALSVAQMEAAAPQINLNAAQMEAAARQAMNAAARRNAAVLGRNVRGGNVSLTIIIMTNFTATPEPDRVDS